MTAKPTITLSTYTALQAAYDYFNQTIWDGKLPQALITLSYHRGAYGYFRADCIAKRNADGSLTKVKKPVSKKTPANAKLVDEIALNPFTFRGRTDAQILSTLVHEQCHMWRDHFGPQPQPKTHHDKHWANKMEEIGLMPSSTGVEGGKRTWQARIALHHRGWRLR